MLAILPVLRTVAAMPALVLALRACMSVPCQLSPANCLPPLLQDPIYVGGKHRRVRGDAYFELVDELLMAVRRRYGSSGK